MNIEVAVSVTENGRKAPNWSLEGDLRGEFSLADFLAFTKQSLIVIADTALREEQALGFDPNPVVAVDGRVGKPVIDVSPLGTLEFTARADLSTVLKETYQKILDKSPVLTGEYKAHNYVFLNGNQVAKDMASLDSWLGTNPNFQDKDLIRFVDTEPYARKLERLGVTYGNEKYSSRSSRTVTSKRKNRGTVVRYNQPNGVYYLTARAIRTKYKRNSIIRFEFISGTQLGIADKGFDDRSRVFTGKRLKKNQLGRAYLYPSIVISVQEDGIL